MPSDTAQLKALYIATLDRLDHKDKLIVQYEGLMRDLLGALIMAKPGTVEKASQAMREALLTHAS
jgi:hypothetical protein